MKLVIDLGWIIPFFNSNFFVALITFLSVLAVIWVYFSQKRDTKIIAAKIILIEISDAENLLDAIKLNGINFVNVRQILNANSWGKYKYLFAKDFTVAELRLIDNFFSNCELLNKELCEAYNLPVYWQDKANVIAEKHIQLSMESSTAEEYELKKKKTNFFEADSYWWQPNGPKAQIVERIRSLQYISHTPVGQKMRDIAKL